MCLECHGWGEKDRGAEAEHSRFAANSLAAQVWGMVRKRGAEAEHSRFAGKRFGCAGMRRRGKARGGSGTQSLYRETVWPRRYEVWMQSAGRKRSTAALQGYGLAVQVWGVDAKRGMEAEHSRFTGIRFGRAVMGHGRKRGAEAEHSCFAANSLAAQVWDRVRKRGAHANRGRR